MIARILFCYGLYPSCRRWSWSWDCGVRRVYYVVNVLTSSPAKFRESDSYTWLSTRVENVQTTAKDSFTGRCLHRRMVVSESTSPYKPHKSSSASSPTTFIFSVSTSGMGSGLLGSAGDITAGMTLFQAFCWAYHSAMTPASQVSPMSSS